MDIELLSPAEMAEADRLTITAGAFDGIGLMRNAGAAVAAVVLARQPQAQRADVLCGPGNNGGDGYIVARLLKEAGVDVSLWTAGTPHPGSDAALAAAECPLPVQPLSEFALQPDCVVIDALYGAGLSKPLEDDAARAAMLCRKADIPVIAVDLPSGVSGDSGQVLGRAFQADATVTFFRKKPGHLLYPGRALCGDVVVAEIGIPPSVLAELKPGCFENAPPLWHERLVRPPLDAHKYSRGHVGVFSGGPTSTGAARLSALAAARAGAGAVTVLAPGSALAVNAMHLTSIMLRRIDDATELREFVAMRPGSAYVIGPGFGSGEKLRDLAVSLLGGGRDLVAAVVLDADAFSSFAAQPDELFQTVLAQPVPAVLTPHEGEFRRVFPDIAADGALSKLARARAAAKRSGAYVVYKGPDTVIAAPDGRAAINANGSPWLATAGSGDALAGIVAGLLAQGMPAFEAACAAVWMHAEAGTRFGPGLIAEDLPQALLPVLHELQASKGA